MKKIIILFVVLVGTLVLLCSCNCKHEKCSEATCTVPSTCLDCGETISAALGHTEVKDPAVAPTCTDSGLTEGSHCSTCAVVLTAQEKVNATGHNYGEWIVETEPTVKKEGLQSMTCANCSDRVTSVIPAKGINVSLIVIIAVVAVLVIGVVGFVVFAVVFKKKK